MPDKCHICIGLVGYLEFILGDLNEYLCDLRPHFSNYACLGFDCRFTCDEPSNRRKNEVEGLEDQGS